MAQGDPHEDGPDVERIRELLARLKRDEHVDDAEALEALGPSFGEHLAASLTAEERTQLVNMGWDGFLHAYTTSQVLGRAQRRGEG
jgi:hypothetical protein